MTLDPIEFIARFSLHILPKKFVRIRHYGILSSTAKRKCAPVIKEQLTGLTFEHTPMPDCRPQPQKYDPKVCPCCNKETMRIILHFKLRPPPGNWMEIAEKTLKYIR